MSDQLLMQIELGRKEMKKKFVVKVVEAVWMSGALY